MSSPKIVVFDLGKVLVDFDYSIAARRIVARCDRALDHAAFFAEHAPLLSRYELGLVNTQQFFEQIRSVSGFGGSREEFGNYFADIFTPIPQMVALHAQLRQRGFPTYIFSNTNELAVRHIKTRFEFFSAFQGYIYSYHHGAMKPDPKLYEVVERTTQCTGEQIIYIDDLPQNVATAAGRGWHSVLQESPDKTIAALLKLGVID